MEQNPILHTALSLDSDIPLYAQLVGIIKRSISTGALPVGALLPSEAELCRCLSISRNTVRQAIGELEDEGLVVRKRGRGTFVADPDLKDVHDVKSATIHAPTGRLAYTQADAPNWWTSRIRLRHPGGEIVRAGERLYKVRWVP